MSKTKQKKVNPYAKQPEKKTNWPLIIVTAVLVAALIVAGVLLLGGKHKNTADDGLLHGTYYAQIDVKDYGTITAELYADTAPITVTNFVNLVNQGFYDGLTFHRIISGFMIQGGDPLGNGTGGSENKIKAWTIPSSTRAACCPWRAPAPITAPAVSSLSCTRTRRIWMASTRPLARCSAAWR